MPVPVSKMPWIVSGQTASTFCSSGIECSWEKAVHESTGKTVCTSPTCLIYCSELLYCVAQFVLVDKCQYQYLKCLEMFQDKLPPPSVQVESNVLEKKQFMSRPVSQSIGPYMYSPKQPKSETVLPRHVILKKMEALESSYMTLIISQECTRAETVQERKLATV